MNTTASKLDTSFKILVIMAIGIYGLILVRDIILPIAFAGIFAVVLNPVVKWFERKMSRILAIMLTLIVAFLVMALVMWFIIAQLTDLAANLPNLESQYLQLVNISTEWVRTNFSISVEEQGNMMKEILTGLSSLATELVSSTGYLAYFFVQVPIYIFLFLFYREKLKKFLESLNPSSAQQWKSEIEGVIRGYISGLTIVVFIASVLNSIGLLALGIDHAIFFGFLSGALTVIPYVGITVGATLPALLALVTKDSVWYAVGVVGVHGFVQFLEGNFITPKITGSKISINAMAAILALLVGGKIWGIPGMILAVPAVGIARILLSYSNTLKPFAELISDSDDREASEAQWEEKRLED